MLDTRIDRPTSQERPLLRGGRSPLRQRMSRWDVKVSPYLYVSPFFILFGVVGLFPLLYTAWVALHEWHLIGGQGDFVGLKNFQDVLGQRFFWNSVRNTLSIFLLSSVPQVILALLIAGALDSGLRAKTFWRMGVLLPYVIAPVAVVLIFNDLFGDKFGLINQALGWVGVDPVQWHKDTLSSHLAIATMVNWRWTGYNALILLAAMQAVPRDLYDASAIDGASRFKQFTRITVPSIRPTVIFVVITSTIGGLQIFAEPRMFDSTLAQNGGSDRQFSTMTMLVYDFGWHLRDLGRASATAWLLFLLIIVIALLNYVLSRRFGALTHLTRRRR
jgi:cellobiose transport system permease protein